MQNMIQRFRFMALVAFLPTLGVCLAAAASREVKPTTQWKGSLPNDEDRALIKVAPKLITTAQDVEKVWKAWRITEKMPEVDFAKHFLLVDTTVGSVLNVRAALDDNGNFRAMGMATRDRRPGFRYVISSFSREGVKTVEGKELPKVEKPTGP